MGENQSRIASSLRWRRGERLVKSWRETKTSKKWRSAASSQGSMSISWYPGTPSMGCRALEAKHQFINALKISRRTNRTTSRSSGSRTSRSKRIWPSSPEWTRSLRRSLSWSKMTQWFLEWIGRTQWPTWLKGILAGSLLPRDSTKMQLTD